MGSIWSAGGCRKLPLAAAVLMAANFLVPGALAQRLSFGVVVGGYANRDFDSQYVPVAGFPPLIRQSDSGGYVVGPSFGVRVSPQLSLGVEALYKPLRYSDAVSFQDGAVIGFAPATVVTWQFPVLARYRLPVGRINAFFEGGPSFRAAGNLNSANPSHFGVSAGMGVEAEWGRLKVAPRVRYTRWAEDTRCGACTRADQLEFLVGFSSAATSDTYPLGRRISLGAVVGSTVSDDFAASTYTAFGDLTYRTSSVRSVAVGPLVELSLSPRFSIEGNAITRSIRGVSEVVSGACPTQELRVCSLSHSSGGFWEFPVLVKYRLSTRSWRPFLAVGPSFRLPKETGGFWLSNYGATVGLGVEIPLKRIKIAPTVRYTHWGPDRPRVGGAQGNSGIFRNQVQVLLGTSF